jgi:hypothetical protein
MIVSTRFAASLATAQPQPVPPVDHAKMDHSGMGMDAAKPKPAKAMDCCKDGCACCAKDKPASR